MLGIVLLTLLGIGATAALAIEVFEDDDDDRPAPETPGETDPDPDAPEDQITGTSGADLLTGTDIGEPIKAGAGDDIVRAGDGGDTVEAGAGNDRAFGEAGEDLISGGPGNDFLRGGADDDLLLDGEGIDTLRGDLGDDLLMSTGIADEAALVDSFATLTEDTTPESVSELASLPGLDLTKDDGTGDVLDGGAGQDAMIFGNGDTVTGGSGFDFFVGGAALGTGAPAIITDFEVNEETIVLTYDGGAAPALSLTDDGDDAVLNLDGAPAVILSGLAGAFSLSDVELIDISA